MLVAPPKNRFLFSKPWGSLSLHQNKYKEKGGNETLGLPGTQNNAIKSVGFYATMVGQSRVSVLPGHERIVKKFNFFDLPLAFSLRLFLCQKNVKKYNFLQLQQCAPRREPDFLKKLNFLEVLGTVRSWAARGRRLSPLMNDGGGKGVGDISEVYYRTQRFVPHLRATVPCTNEWRHIHRVEHGLFSQVLHKVVPTQKLWKSKVSLEPFQSIKQWVSIQWIRLTLKNYEGSIGW